MWFTGRSRTHDLYQTVFDISESVPWRGLWFASAGAFMMAVGYAMWLFANDRAPRWLDTIVEQMPRRKPMSKQSLKTFAGLFIAFGLLWVVFAGTGIVGGWLSYRQALASGAHEVVEGIVENFDPMPHGGHKPETFTVNGVWFSYSDYNVTPAFNRSRSHGGPIRNGLPVRISYVAEQAHHPILKLEIPASEPANSDHDESIERPALPFGVFVALMLGFGAAISWLLFFNRNAALKRRLFPVLVVLGSLVFVFYTLDTGSPPLFVAFIVPITLLNLWITRFCDACGATVISQKLWQRPRECTKCGRPLG
jgi:hypothetical protein